MSELFACRFFVHGVPVGKPSIRAGVSKRGARCIPVVRGADSDHPIHRWLGCIRSEAIRYRPRRPIEGPVELRMDIFLPAPQRVIRHGRLTETYATVKPDRDNVEKGVQDVLTELGFWRDDAQVVMGATRKFWAKPDEAPGCRIVIEELVDPIAGVARQLELGATA